MEELKYNSGKENTRRKARSNDSGSFSKSERMKETSCKFREDESNVLD